MTAPSKISTSMATALLLLFAVRVVAGQEASGALFAVSDGKGHISLLWFPPPSKWPAGGWKLSDSTGQVLVPQIKIGEPTAMGPLSVEDQDTIQKLSSALAVPDSSQQRKNLLAILSLRVFSEPSFARALGLSW